MTDRSPTTDGIKKDLIQFYNQDAARRASKKSNPEAWKLEHRDRFTRMCIDQSAQTLLDIGASPGRDSEHFESYGLRSYPFDLSPGMIAKCRESKLSASRMDAHSLGFGDQTFDAIWSLNSLLHIPRAHIDSVGQEIYRVMKPNASFRSTRMRISKPASPSTLPSCGLIVRTPKTRPSTSKA